MSSTHSMNARKCVHAQNLCPTQAFAHESSKVGEREKREGERQESQARRLMERKAAHQNHIGGTKTRPSYLGTAKGDKVGGGTLNFP